ncbi:MAG: protein FlhF [Desulfobacter sp.]|nr:MAG: protein FlhF [Desulfobacter sp.]
MNKKIFRAANIQDALACIKDEMGPEAMILSTRKLPRSPRDPYGKEMFEVEAGIKDEGRVPEETVKQAVPAGASTDLDALRSDLAEIKDMVALAGMGTGVDAVLGNHFESVGILASMIRAGVSDGLAAALIREAVEKTETAAPWPDPAQQVKAIKKKVMQLCLERLKCEDFFSRSNNGIGGHPHVAAFVGPTGVGKTTTIAKLAALLTFHRKMKVGLVSIDNYRIGAFEQLKAYAGIMGLPCVPAFSGKDLSSALDRMGGMDMVLVDTAGHSHYDKEKLDEILGLISKASRISIHLTLSVTAELINMKEAASAFSVFNPDTYVFTKIDETRRCGKILDQVGNFNMPVSLVTNGQKVPEDLIVPDKPALLKIILGTGPKGD